MSRLFNEDEHISDVVKEDNILNPIVYDLFKLILKEKCNHINFSQSSIDEIIRDAIHCEEFLVKYNIVKGNNENDS